MLDGELIEKEDIIKLLNTEMPSAESGAVTALADRINRRASGNRAEIHAQIGLNLSPCPRNCSFCAFAAKNRVFESTNHIPMEDIIAITNNCHKTIWFCKLR